MVKSFFVLFMLVPFLAVAEMGGRGDFYAFEKFWIASQRVGPPAINEFLYSNVYGKNNSICLSIKSKEGGGVTSAEFRSSEKMWYGTYLIELNYLPEFEKKYVFGFFTYPSVDIGPDGTNEIDIEISRWGSAARPRGNFGLFTALRSIAHKPIVNRFDLPPINERTFLAVIWEPDYIRYLIFTDKELLKSWDIYDDGRGIIPKYPQSVYINFWSLDNKYQSEPAELCVNGFSYLPSFKGGL